MRPGYPPASAGEPITKVTCSLNNGITCVQNTDQVVIDPQLAVEFEKKETARIAAEKKRLAQQRVLTVTSGTQYGTVKLLYRDTLYWNCVSFVKAQTGIYRSLGNGARAGIQGYTPQVGAIGAVIGRVHAVYITAINGDQVTFTESNYVRGWITQRTLPTSYFLGFVYN